LPKKQNRLFLLQARVFLLARNSSHWIFQS
jgi:hypothetical protein